LVRPGFGPAAELLDPQLATAYETSLLAPPIVVVTGDARSQETHDVLRAIHAPMRAVVFVPREGVARDRVVRVLPFVGALAPGPADGDIRVQERQCGRE
jgi:hypothetical protein